MGWPHPDYLLEFLTPGQWIEWVEYFGLEPWGFDVDDAGMGTLAAVVAAAAGAKGVKPSDYMMGPNLVAREQQQQEEHTKMLVARLMASATWGPKPAEAPPEQPPAAAPAPPAPKPKPAAKTKARPKGTTR